MYVTVRSGRLGYPVPPQLVRAAQDPSGKISQSNDRSVTGLLKMIVMVVTPSLFVRKVSYTRLLPLRCALLIVSVLLPWAASVVPSVMGL